MKKNTLITFAIVVAGIVMVLALKPFRKKEAAETFETVKVEKGNISNTVTATGTVQAIKTVKVGTQVSGILKGVYVDFNDVVKKGQLLARLDETSLRAQMEQSQSQVDQAQAQLNYNESTYKRMKALFEKNLISQADYDQALYNYESSRAAVVNSESNLARSKVNLDYATITSPIEGVVLNRAVEEGQTVAASFNTPELFTIVNDLTRMEVQTSVDEADIGKVAQGQRVEFSVDAYPEMKFEGTVSEVRLQPVTTNNVVTYNVILLAPNPDKKLMPGMTASATIYIEERNDVMILSAKAIRFIPNQEYLQKMLAKVQAESNAQELPEEGGKVSGGSIDGGQVQITSDQKPEGTMKNEDLKSRVVWLKNEKSGIRRNKIIIGIDNGTNVEILSGLKEGDEVIISMSGGSDAKSRSRNSEGPRPPMFGPGAGG
ncbi:MAG TPA: efflux RND transporter periplasmic adaptor subunit [Bacteroidales bacterium]|nr:efflux RND transporter periplasmic adaptor subunit [Bacteroidales bacterium]